MKLISLPSFSRRFRKLSEAERDEVKAVGARLPDVFGRPHLHSGIGLRPFGPFFEFRVGLELRVLFRVVDGDARLVCVGDHNEIRAFVKNNS